MEEALTRKEQREQRRQEKREQKASQLQRTRNKKLILFGLLILGVVGLIWVVAASQQQAPIVDISPDPSRGPETAKVLIEEYADFQCPACAGTAPVLHEILEEYGDQVRFEYNDFPLPQHNNATTAAIAGQCAFDQGKFFELSDFFYTRQKDWSNLSTEDAQKKFTEYAEELGLDMTAFATCTTGQSAADRVNEDISEGRSARVNSTPTFMVNGKRIVTTPFSTNLRKAIDDALAAAE